MRKFCLLLMFVLAAQPALAHARLVKSVPEAGSRSGDVDKVVLEAPEQAGPCSLLTVIPTPAGGALRRLPRGRRRLRHNMR